MQSNVHQCYLHIRQDTHHDVRSKPSHKDRLKNKILGRLKIGSLNKNTEAQKADSKQAVSAKKMTTNGSLIWVDSQKQIIKIQSKEENWQMKNKSK